MIYTSISQVYLCCRFVLSDVSPVKWSFALNMFKTFFLSGYTILNNDTSVRNYLTSENAINTIKKSCF